MTDPTTNPTVESTAESAPNPAAEPAIDPIDTICEHILHPNGLHEFILREFGMTGANAFLTQIERLYQGRTNDDPPLLLIMNAPGSLPITYTMQRGKDMMANYPDVGLMRVGVLSDSAFEAKLVDSFLRLMRFPGLKMRFFDAAKRADAEKWLFEGK